MSHCPIAESISKYADEPEQLSACEILTELADGKVMTIGNRNYELVDIADKVDSFDLSVASYNHVCGDLTAIRKVYIETIEGLM